VAIHVAGNGKKAINKSVNIPESFMKNFILALLISAIFLMCAKNETGFIQSRPNREAASGAALKKSKTLIQPKWTAGSYLGLQLGKSTVADVRRIFGEPKYIIHPEDEYDNPIETRLDYVYDGSPQIIIDKKSKIVVEIWGGDFSTLREATAKYGNDFYELEFTEKGCVFKEYEEQRNRQYPLYLAYPQYGFYFCLNEENDVLVISYVAKCR
jgi:hypothetical protein